MRHDPAVIAAVCLAAETAVGRAIALSAGTQSELAQLYPLTIAIHCVRPAVDIFVIIAEGGDVNVASHHEMKPTLAIEGTFQDFLSVASAADPASALINGNIKISGDTAPLLRLQGVISRLDIDWEAPIVAAVGAVPGHEIARVIRLVTRTSKKTHHRIRRQVSEFILEEGRLSPSQAEQNAFFTSVDDTVLRVDRAESLIKRLERRIAALGDASS